MLLPWNNPWGGSEQNLHFSLSAALTEWNELVANTFLDIIMIQI